MQITLISQKNQFGLKILWIVSLLSSNSTQKIVKISSELKFFPALPLSAVQAQPSLPTPFPRAQVLNKWTNCSICQWQLSFNRRSLPGGGISWFLHDWKTSCPIHHSSRQCTTIISTLILWCIFHFMWTGSNAMNIDSAKINTMIMMRIWASGNFYAPCAVSPSAPLLRSGILLYK